MEPNDAFEILGVPSSATPGEIKEAYRDLSKVWHPDRFGSDPRLRAKAEERLKRINEAYQYLQAPHAQHRAGPRSSPATEPDAASSYGSYTTTNQADRQRPAAPDWPASPPPAARSTAPAKYWIYGATTFAIAFAFAGLFASSFTRGEATAPSAATADPEPAHTVSGATPQRAADGPAARKKPVAAAGALPDEAPQPPPGPSASAAVVIESPFEIPGAPRTPAFEGSGTAPAPSTQSAADTAVPAGGNLLQAFVKSWTGRSVIVRAPLYSLSFNERGKLGTTRRGLHEGLVVVTPSRGMYLQFNGRQGRDDVVERDPERVVRAVNTAYEADSLEVRSYRKLEPIGVDRYDPGVELVVNDVRVAGDQVRLELAPAGALGENAAVTSLTVLWPAPLSKSFTEHDLVEDLIRRFVEVRRP